MSDLRDEFAQMRQALQRMSDEELMGELWPNYMRTRELMGLRQGEEIDRVAFGVWLLGYLRQKRQGEGRGV